jgi:hypothetical protein
LEFDEVKLLTEMGHDVFSNGAYTDPAGAYTLPRPGIPNAIYHQEMADIARRTPRTDFPPELIEPFDTFIIMHSPDILIQNWEKIKHKRVIWRTIGQSTPSLERRIQKMRAEGLQIVRYSPAEKNLAEYAGHDTIIRFYKDPNEFTDWNGSNNTVVNFTQSLKGRRDFCHYNEIMAVIEAFDGKVYGTGNDDLGGYNGGELPYDLQKQVMRDARAMVYGGTWPASYTLSLIEAMMTGMPIVSIDKAQAMVQSFENLDFFEVDTIIQNGTSGLICPTPEVMRKQVQRLLNDYDYAKEISINARKRAIELFGKDTIKKQWERFLK